MSEQESAFREVASYVNPDELEQGILEYWEGEHIFEKSVVSSKDSPLFTFYDGPPYATGKPHYGHVLQSAIKDTVLRYKTMRGFHVPRRVGWDTHGLPVEVLVEKELGMKSKKDIEELGIEKFNQACRDTVYRYIDEFTTTLKRLGRWADYDDSYSTLDKNYMESEWWVFRQLWDRELIYKDFRSTPYCIRCATPLSNWELGMAYKDKEDDAVYVRLKVKNGPTSPGLRGADQKRELLIWTTTPWTLPANVAVAIGEELEYVSVKHEDRELIVAKDRVEAVFGDDVELVKTWTQDELLGLTYEGLYSNGEAPFTVVIGGHVTAEDGTGIVHMAPAFGAEDAEVGKKEGLPTLRTVDTQGNFNSEVEKFSGQNIFEANRDIIADLKERGLLFKEERYTHSYPHCWRCDEPLIYYALDSWFIRVTEIKDKMLANNQQISWTPKHVKDGRFGKGLETAPDWAVSRNRFWSTPIPVWECDGCDEVACIGSEEELKEKSGQELEDLHRPFIDEVTWPCFAKASQGKPCSGTMRRIPEVLDVWFDSGSMPYAQWHYPFENKELVEKGYPADFISEAIEMTRAWFFFLHVIATALTKENIGLGKDKPAFKAAVGSGLIFAEDGNKLSKKLKNYPEINPTLEKYGADVLRMYLLSSASLGEPYRFSEKDIQQLQRNMYMTLWNVYSFFVRYANVCGFTDGEVTSDNVLDAWILAKLKQLRLNVVRASDAYEVDAASRKLKEFVDDLSNWYVRRNRDRFQAGDETAFAVLKHVLVEYSKLAAPYMPFVCEEMYRNLTGGESVHLERLEDGGELIDEETTLMATMKQVREVVSDGLSKRAAEGIKVRQPLAALRAPAGDNDLADYVDILQDEVNVKSVEFVPALEEVELDTELTEELKLEGQARDVIRTGQNLRKKAGYALDDRIMLIVDTEELVDLWSAFGDMIEEALQVDTVVAAGDADETGDAKINGTKIRIGVTRLVLF